MALELFYTFNNQDSKDYSENGLDGTDSNMSYAAGDVGYNAVLNSTSDGISHGTFNPLGGLTEVGFYFRIKFATTSGTKYICFKQGQYYATYDGTTFSFSIVGATGTATVSTAVSTGQYYQVHVNYLHNGAANDMSIYLDNVVANSVTTQGAVVSNTNIAYVGGDAGLGLADAANFELSEYKIFSNISTAYNREAHINNINGLQLSVSRDIYNLGDILVTNVNKANKGYAIVTYVSGNDVRIQPLNSYITVDDSFIRIGHLWDTDRQYSLNIRKDSIDLYDGVSLSSEVLSASKKTLSITVDGIILNSTTKTANYTVVNSDSLVYVDSTSGTFTITLPSEPITNKQLLIIDKMGNCGTNKVTVDGNGKNIIGSSTALMDSNYISYDMIYNGTQWNLK